MASRWIAAAASGLFVVTVSASPNLQTTSVSDVEKRPRIDPIVQRILRDEFESRSVADPFVLVLPASQRSAGDEEKGAMSIGCGREDAVLMRDPSRETKADASDEVAADNDYEFGNLLGDGTPFDRTEISTELAPDANPAQP